MVREYISSFVNWWRGKLKARDEERIKRSEIYNKLVGQFEEQEKILRQFQEELIETKAHSLEYEKCSSAKLSERDRRISELEEQLANEKKVEESVREYIALLEEEAKAEEEREKLTEENKKLSDAFKLSKKYLFGFRELHKKTAEELDKKNREIEEQRDKIEKVVRESYYGGLEALSAHFKLAVEEVKSNVKKYVESMSEVIAGIFKINEEFGLFDKVEGVYLDSNLKPIFATRAFYKAFDLSFASDLLSAPSMAEVIEYAKKRTKDLYDFRIKCGNDERTVKLHFRYALNGAGTIIGVFVEYKHKAGLFGKLIGSGSAREKAMTNIEKLLEAAGGGSPQAQTSS